MISEIKFFEILKVSRGLQRKPNGLSFDLIWVRTTKFSSSQSLKVKKSTSVNIFLNFAIKFSC